MATAVPHRIARSITLLRVFVVASAVVLASGALVLGSTVTKILRTQAVDDAKLSVTEYADSVVGRYVVHGSRIEVPADALAILRRDVASRRDILSVKVWKHDGVLAWTSLAPQRIGKRFPVDGELAETLEHGETAAGLEPLDEVGEDAVEARAHSGDVLEIYAPIHAEQGQVLGAYEIYADPAAVHAAIARGRKTIWLAVGGVFLALYLTLVLLVRGASRLLRPRPTACRSAPASSASRTSSSSAVRWKPSRR